MVSVRSWNRISRVSYFTLSLCLIVIISIGSPACVYEKAEILYPSSPCDTTGINYSEEIVQLLMANCYSCHSTQNSVVLGGGIILDQYHELKHHVDDGTIVGVINHLPGYPEMPKNAAKLSECDIDKIETWIRAGAPEN
ncbi:hypothetical protein [Pollutibacter soli]|uniref:hypothetical protein n=1 Tax=Pollutibacter soli TaxID=3034157 RepID=UPI0030133CEB